MTFLSYAQNFEDVMLHRALQDVDRGFYIDVGAQHPTNDSVTRAFYERGWRGINIDPVPQWAELLRTERPHDINLQLALGAEGGHKLMFSVADTGLSTDNEAFVRRHIAAGYHAQSLEVDVSTLDAVCEQHGISTVHFLKIDVEGAEVEVIRGFSFDRVRPWVVLVEAIEPVTSVDSVDSVPSYQSWEPMLLARGYQFVYDDGLNRFYLAQEKSELRRHFVLPPNPLDSYIRYQEWIKHERILQLDRELKELTDARDLGAIRKELQQLHDLRHAEQVDHENLLRDSDNRLQRISVLEQENAVFQVMQAQRQVEIENLARDGLNRIHRIAVLEQENAALQAVDAQRQAELERMARFVAESVQRAMLTERENAAVQSKRDADATERARALDQQVIEERNRRLALEQEMEALRRRQLAQMELSKHLEATVGDILHSTSWRITKPLRWLRRTLAGDARRMAANGSVCVAGSLVEKHAAASFDESSHRSLRRSTVKQGLLVLTRTAFKYPALGRAFWRGFSLFPRTKSRLVLFINNNRQSIGAPTDSAEDAKAVSPTALSLEPTSEKVAAVHQRLSLAIERKADDGSNSGQTGKSTS